MTTDQRDATSRSRTGGWLVSRLAQWVLGLVGGYAELVAAAVGVAGKVPTLLRVPRALRSLDVGARVVAVACLVLLALLVAATRFLSGAPAGVSTLTWTDTGQAFALPRPALWLSLAGWAASAAAILTGASRWGLIPLLGAGPLQLFAVVFVAFAGGKAYWLAAPSWLLPLFAAASPAVARSRTARVVGTTLLCALATWHTYLFTPLSAHGTPPRWEWLVPVWAISVPLLLRLPPRLTAWAGFGLAVAVNAGVIGLAWLRVGEAAMARGLVLPASFFVGLFAVMWFALGGEMVAGAVSAANSAIKVAALAVRAALLPVLVGALCLAEVVVAPWVLERLSPPDAMTLSLHRWLALGLLAVGVALAVTRRLTAQWTRALLAVWVFGLAALRSYFSDATELAAYADPRELKGLALTLFTFAMAMQVVRLLIEKQETRRHSPDARLLLQLGALTFLATGTQLGFAVDNTQVMKEAAVYQFSGATALFLPLLLALLVAEQRWLPAPSRALLTRGFLAGFAAAFALQVVRIVTYGPGGWSLDGHLGALALGEAAKAACIAALILGAGAVGPLDAVSVAIACALGFAAGYAQNLPVLMLDAAVKTLLALTVRIPAVSGSLSALVDGYIRMRPSVPAADHYHLFVAALLPAAIMGWGIAKAARERRPGIAAVGILGGIAVSLGMAWGLEIHPLFMTESRQPIPFYVVLTDASALAPLLVPVLALAAWTYVVVWRPERRAPGRTPTASAVDAPTRRPAWVAATAAALPVAVVAAAGVGVALRSQSPMLEYRDPEGRFAIDYPRSWLVERRPTGETVFYRDDPTHGALVMVHPGITLAGQVSANQLVAALERQIRGVYPDARLTASAASPRLQGGRSLQRIDLTAAWTAPARGRFRGQSTVILASATEGSRFGYVTYQIPEPASPSLEAQLARVLRSHRPRDPG